MQSSVSVAPVLVPLGAAMLSPGVQVTVSRNGSEGLGEEIRKTLEIRNKKEVFLQKK